MSKLEDQMTVDDILAGLTPAEQRAVALLSTMIRWHGGRAGDGLFTGPGRYEVLAGRVRESAVTSRSVRAFWDRTARRMRWSIGPVSSDADVLALIGPSDTDQETLRALADRTDSVVRIARSLRERRDASPADDGTGVPPASDTPDDDIADL